jgi:hypothetical protein
MIFLGESKIEAKFGRSEIIAKIVQARLFL